MVVRKFEPVAGLVETDSAARCGLGARAIRAVPG